MQQISSLHSFPCSSLASTLGWINFWDTQGIPIWLGCVEEWIIQKHESKIQRSLCRGVFAETLHCCGLAKEEYAQENCWLFSKFTKDTQVVLLCCARGCSRKLAMGTSGNFSVLLSKLIMTRKAINTTIKYSCTWCNQFPQLFLADCKMVERKTQNNKMRTSKLHN